MKAIKGLVALAGAAILAGCGPAAETPSAADDPATARWAALAKLPDWSGVWEVDWRNERGAPPRPAMKLTPEGQAQLDAYRAGQARGENLQSDAANCVPPGVPGIMSQPYPIEFLYQPGKVVMLTEAFMQARHIYTDGRPLPEDPDPYFNGHSIGRWEGDTLVVETVGLNEQNRLAPGLRHGEQLRITERIRRDGEWLVIQTTLDDPSVFVEPWVYETNYRHLDDELREYICLENNRAGADAQGRPLMRLE